MQHTSDTEPTNTQTYIRKDVNTHMNKHNEHQYLGNSGAVQARVFLLAADSRE